jgi:phosphomannomutase
MVTASHNPPDDIGMKLCREDAIPIGKGSGLEAIETAADGAIVERMGGRRQEQSILPDYVRHIRHALAPGRALKVAVDCAGGAVGPIFEKIFDGGVFPAAFERLCFAPDPTFARHEPDPLKDKNVADLAEAVRRSGAEAGIAFDGDGDRCIFLDRQGRRVSSDLITILLAQEALTRLPGSHVVYDLRSSRAVPEEIRKAGGVPVRERVGHAFIKLTMRKHQAAFGGELSGHFYFKEHSYADSGLLACARMLSILASGPQTLEERVAPYRRYHATGELNFEVADKEGAMARIARSFSGHEQDTLDGITVSAADWWFNVRPSNTEPRLRLNLEAASEGRREEIRGRLLELLGRPL